jgi:hypothetical protein
VLVLLVLPLGLMLLMPLLRLLRRLRASHAG